MSCSVVENPDAQTTGYINVAKLMDQETWSKYMGFAHEKLNPKDLDNFQTELKFKFEKTFDASIAKDGVVYAD